MENISTNYFKALEQIDFLTLEHTSSLKGLFKGKGYDILASNCEQLREQLIHLGKVQVLEQVKAYPFALLPIEMAVQTTGAGTAFLRWRKKDRSVMGVHLWDELITSSSVSESLINDLYVLEVQRITLNMQISVVHSVARRARECVVKIAHAQQIVKKRQNMSR